MAKPPKYIEIKVQEVDYYDLEDTSFDEYYEVPDDVVAIERLIFSLPPLYRQLLLLKMLKCNLRDIKKLTELRNFEEVKKHTDIMLEAVKNSVFLSKGIIR